MILSVSQVKIVYLKGSRKSAKNAAKTWYTAKDTHLYQLGQTKHYCFKRGIRYVLSQLLRAKPEWKQRDLNKIWRFQITKNWLWSAQSINLLIHHRCSRWHKRELAFALEKVNSNFLPFAGVCSSPLNRSTLRWPVSCGKRPLFSDIKARFLISF